MWSSIAGCNTNVAGVIIEQLLYYMCMCIGRLFGTFIDDRIKEIDYCSDSHNHRAMDTMLEYYGCLIKHVVHGQSLL